MLKNMISLRKYPGNKDFAWCVSTLCGLGFVSNMPGTLGSVAAFFIYVFFPVPLYIIILIALLGLYTSQIYSKRIGEEDPKEVIVDEVVGVWLAMYGLPSGFFLPALFLFRVVDILKPFPINTAEKLPGGWGIMADDIVGGIIVNLILMLIRWLYLGGGWNLFL